MILIGVVLNVLTSIIIIATEAEKKFPEHSELTKQLMDNKFIVTLLIVGILVPIFEEILFRGLIYKELLKSDKIWLAVIGQALIFAIYHGNVLQGCYAFILGMVTVLVYRWLKTIWAPILVHLSYNTTSTIKSHYPSDGKWIFALIGIFTLIIIIDYFNNKRKKQEVVS